MAGREEDFYQKLRTKLKKWLAGQEGSQHRWADYLLWAPDLFYLMWKLSTDDRVSQKSKLKLLAAIAYFISPLDLIPEAIFGPGAYVDDIALAAWVLNSLLSETDPQVIRDHWPGEEDVLEVIKKILDVADRMVGSGVWRKLKGSLK